MKKIIICCILLLLCLPVSASASTVAEGTCGKQHGLEYDGNGNYKMETLLWSLSDSGVFIITGDGEMADNPYVSHVPWGEYKSQIKKVVISNGVKNIGLAAFTDCVNLENVSLPDTLLKIGSYAFCGCSRLKNINIPASVSQIDAGAFDRCTALCDITVDSANKHYCSDSGVLYSKDKTVLIQYPIGKQDETFSLPNSVKVISENSFKNATLSYIEFGKSVSVIEKDAFRGCHTLKTPAFPDSLLSIGDTAFMDCTSIEKLDLPENLDRIGNNAFMSCQSLCFVYIPQSLHTTGDDIFSGCNSLSLIKYEGNSDAWNTLKLCPVKSYTLLRCSDSPIAVTVNGKPVSFDQNPVISGGRTIVPMRKIFEVLGAEITWDDTTKTVTSSKDGIIISLTISDNVMLKNGVPIILDTPPVIISDRTMIPVRAVAEAFDCAVNWNDDIKTVEITIKD